MVLADWGRGVRLLSDTSNFFYIQARKEYWFKSFLYLINLFIAHYVVSQDDVLEKLQELKEKKVEKDKKKKEREEKKREQVESKLEKEREKEEKKQEKEEQKRQKKLEKREKKQRKVKTKRKAESSDDDEFDNEKSGR